MPRYNRILSALLLGPAILVLGTVSSAIAAPPAPSPEHLILPPPATDIASLLKRHDALGHLPAAASRPLQDVTSVKQGPNGQVDVTSYTPAPGVSVEKLLDKLTALGLDGVVTASDEAAAPAASASAGSSDACGHGNARTIRCPSAHWANSGLADPQVRFISTAGPEWPVKAAVDEWNRATGIDSYYHAQQQCSFPAGNHCVSVQDANYGATGWVGRTSYSYNTRTHNLVENSVSVKLNDYYALNADGRRQTVCHELGHTLGLGHNVRDLSCLWHKTTNSGHRVPDGDDYSLLEKLYSVTH